MPRTRGVRTVGAVAALCAVVAARATAQENEREYRNSLGLFIGTTIEDGEEGSFTLGLDYERRLSKPFGVGVLLDKPFGGSRSFIVAGGFFWHPIGPVRLDLAPGIEVNQDEDDAFVLRLGADYDFELAERWSLAPNANLDLVDGKTVWVIGVELGYRF